jgi:hypothetical protein
MKIKRRPDPDQAEDHFDKSFDHGFVTSLTNEPRQPQARASLIWLLVAATICFLCEKMASCGRFDLRKRFIFLWRDLKNE